MAQEKYQFFATTPMGMEPLLDQELREIGCLDVQSTRGGVQFQGTLETAYRVCLWSRIANRVLLPLSTFPAADPDRLYGGVRKIHWTDHLTSKNTLAVTFTTSQSKITHTQFGALKVKDAIVDQFRAVQGERPSVDPFRPDLRINVHLQQDVATVSLDLSGESLHRRGYREDGAKAPLKENLAAAILKLAGWPHSDPIPLLDPMCGSGTLLIEAATLAAQMAPGLKRDYFGFKGWLGHIPALWKRLVAEAEAQQIRDPKKLPRIVGYDENFRAVRVALGNIEKAGLRGKIHVEKRELALCESIGSSGIVVTNPPYGERLGEIEELKGLYKRLGDTFKQKFKGWEGYIFTGSPELAKSVGLKASRKTVLFNGPIECRLLKYELY